MNTSGTATETAVPGAEAQARPQLSRAQKSWAFTLLWIALAVLWIVIIGAAWGSAEANADEASPRVEDEYDFKWLDPEKRIYVLQNRRYTKALRPLLTGLVGAGFSNPYRSLYNVDGRAAFYISEAFGIEGFYSLASNSENSTFTALAQASGSALPSIREIRSGFGLLVHWVPWYAKINVFNKILYFDWYFAGGGALLSTYVDTRTSYLAAPNYVRQDLPAIVLGTGHLYRVTQNFVVRLDFTGQIYQAPIQGLSGTNAWYSNYIASLGIGWLF